MVLFSLNRIFAVEHYCIMYKVRRMLVWLRRWKYSRGFGVQSPWAYRFIRYVVNEHYPYYAYDDLLEHYGNLSKRTLKMCRLYFRVVNYRRPAVVLDYGSAPEAYGAYMKAGCRDTKVLKVNEPADISKVELLRMSLEDDYREVFEKAVEVADTHSLIIVERIKRSAETKAFWRSVVDDPRCVTTFDLYYCGIIFFDHKRYKENYIVNF